MTTLVFDYDGSLASIGNDQTLLKCFGIMPIKIYKGLEQTKSVIKKLIKPVKTKLSHPLLDNEVVYEEGFELSERSKEMKLGCIVFDTASALGFQERNQIKVNRHIDTLDQRGWGYYGDNLNTFIYNMCSLPVKVIFNVHSDREQNSYGEVLELPALKGSCKNEVQKWFDVILFTKVIQDPKTKELQFCWITKPEDGRFAKDRLNILPSIIPQNFGYVFQKYEEAGIPYPKILVIGESGTGKSRALSTINNRSNKKSELKIAS